MATNFQLNETDIISVITELSPDGTKTFIKEIRKYDQR